MNQKRFEQLYEEQWVAFEQLLDYLEMRPKKRSGSNKETTSFPQHYRRLCSQYGLARSRHYSPALVDKLHILVLRGHHQLYRKKTNFIWQGISFLAWEFPRTVRSNIGAFWLAFLLFFGPAVLVGTTTYNDPVFIYSVMDEQQVGQMESMYNPENRKIGREKKRNSETDLAMFGYYIMNNISIGFKTFAGGIIFGIGSIFFLVYNGTMIGSVAGHLSHPPFASIFWQFVAGHGAFELIAIVISGAAGLILGRSLLAPGNFSRTDSLRLHAPVALNLVLGVMCMLIVAAFIEAFWSSSSASPFIKYTVACLNWSLVFGYFMFCGRRRQ